MSDAKVHNYSLKEAETNTLNIIQQSHQRNFAATLSLIAQERMGYKVTERTQFKLNPELTEIEISELDEDVPTIPAPPEDAPTEENSPVVKA